MKTKHLTVQSITTKSDKLSYDVKPDTYNTKYQDDTISVLSDNQLIIYL